LLFYAKEKGYDIVGIVGKQRNGDAG